MTDDRATTAWSMAVGADPEGMERGDLDELLVNVRLARSRLDAVEVRATRRLRQLADAGRSECAEHAIATTTNRTGRQARDVAARDELCAEQPALEDALADGMVGAAHLDAINVAGRSLPGEVLAEYRSHADDLMARAQRVPLEVFQRECRELAKHLLVVSRTGDDTDELEAQRAASKVTRWVDRSTGMHHTVLELDPIRDAKLNASINRNLARRRATEQNTGVPWQQMMVDATLDAITGDTVTSAETCDDRDPAPGGGAVDRVPEVTIVVDYDRLVDELDELDDTGVCETENGEPIPAETARRACCDAEIIPVVLDGDGRVLDQGRAKRTATREQRQALRSMHRGCAHPGCSVGFASCRIHHIRHWLRHRGRTDLANLLPLCERHHHLVHEGGWGLSMTRDRVATWTRPDGHVHHAGSTIDRTSIPRTGQPTLT